jgi:hypothetical protein
MKHNLKGRTGVVIAVGVVLLLVAGTMLASAAGPEVPRYVIGGGGGHSETAPFVLDATAGQAVAGVAVGGRFELCAGFWCGMGEHRLRLPVVLRSG